MSSGFSNRHPDNTRTGNTTTISTTSTSIGTTSNASRATNDMMMVNHENGPRAKCDQVIFEAMAKAAEIIVNGRNASTASSVMSSGGTPTSGQQQRHHQNNNGGNPNNSSSRFNLIVPEIPEVR